MRKLRSKKGFTLAELLIVVAIIGVLAAIAIPTFGSAVTKAKQAADDANIRAAYAEHQIHTIDSSLSGDASVSGTTITFSGGSYTLQYYDSVTTGPGVWVGVKS